MTSRERHVLIGGALAVILILAIGLGPRLLRSGDATEQMGLEQERIARLRGFAASLDTAGRVARRAAVAERRVVERYLVGSTTQVAAAQLSAEIRRLAEGAQVEIVKEGGMPPREMSLATAIPLQVVARSDLAGLLELLAGVRRSSLLLSVDELSVSGDPRQQPGTPALMLTAQITGYMLPRNRQGELR